MTLSNRWTCDACREEIIMAEEGWIEWLVKKESDAWSGRGLRLVHYRPHSQGNQCQYPQQAEHRADGSILLDLPLKSLLGPDGLMELLHMLARGELPQAEVLEMIKRLHIPGYEQARPHLAPAIAAGALEPDSSTGYPRSSEIQATFAWKAQQRRCPRRRPSSSTK